MVVRTVSREGREGREVVRVVRVVSVVRVVRLCKRRRSLWEGPDPSAILHPTLCTIALRVRCRVVGRAFSGACGSESIAESPLCEEWRRNLYWTLHIGLGVLYWTFLHGRVSVVSYCRTPFRSIFARL